MEHLITIFDFLISNFHKGWFVPALSIGCILLCFKRHSKKKDILDSLVNLYNGDLRVIDNPSAFYDLISELFGKVKSIKPIIQNIHQRDIIHYSYSCDKDTQIRNLIEEIAININCKKIENKLIQKEDIFYIGVF